MLIKYLFVLMATANLTVRASELPPNLTKFGKNKCIPKVIERPVLIALSYYPELEDTHIKFVFKKRINGSVMQAQPLPISIIKRRENREYQINISSMLKLVSSATPIHQLPDNIMIGWIGHELGHIMDYEQRSKFGLIKFGIGYLLSSGYRRQGETNADTYAVNHGLADYIIATKRFILEHAELPKEYKEKIARLYLSPDDIVEQVRKLEEKKVTEQKKALHQ
ncbi:hypothetical protein [Desertivirga brevis]|uniref:hypothetical protein n=1 Tax=Desertivirga brevis TaxID=2810310 RepID=UPI001A9747FC|nr:hypothetical protein [Pedobacter sp. SYSU D00873]